MNRLAAALYDRAMANLEAAGLSRGARSSYPRWRAGSSRSGRPPGGNLETVVRPTVRGYLGVAR
jgi:hypothetical protein